MKGSVEERGDNLIMEEIKIPVNLQDFRDEMTREETHDWENYEMEPLEGLATLIELGRRGLKKDRSENPGMEQMLLALESIENQANVIIDRSWKVAAAATALAPALVGLAAAVNLNPATGVGVGLFCYLPMLALGFPLVKIISSDVIFTPQAQKFVQDRVNFG